jgi:hypothetical protein
MKKNILTILFLITTQLIFADEVNSKLVLQEPFSTMIDENPNLLKIGGVVSKEIGDSLAILVVVQTFNKVPSQRIIVARNIASKELVKFFEGFEVDSQTRLTTNTQVEDTDLQDNKPASSIDESLVSIAKAAIRDLPVLQYYTDKDGAFIAAYGAVFKK